ncbi:hypothetical protein FOXYS1_2771 [Fusarium oxysporum]|uniref:CHAT domain-containing protein n=1 Tax=Fusarium oxysporum TaxID=5507 RepID=A0A8H5EMI6_FUSOX|nr:hypothetical protein FOXYS1_2771 [Fusarium oxysporum]
MSRNEDLENMIEQLKDFFAPYQPLQPDVRSPVESSPSEGRAQQFSDLKGSLRLCKEALGALIIQKEHHDIPNNLFKGGLAKQELFRHTRNEADLDEAICLMERAVDATPKDNKALPYRQSRLAAALSSRFRLFGRQEDLTKAIELGRNAISNPAELDEERPRRLLVLSNCLAHEYNRTDDTAILEEAIRLMKDVIELTPEDSQDRDLKLCDLALLKDHRLERIREIFDFEGLSAPDHLEVHSNHAFRAKRLKQLYTQFYPSEPEREPIASLKEDIAFMNKAINNFQGSCTYEAGLFSGLKGLHESGVPELDVFSCLETAYEQPILKATLYSNLGSLYERLYEWEGDEAQLNLAIETSGKAIGLVSPDNAYYPILQNSLGLLLHQKHLTLKFNYGPSEQHQSKLCYLEKAIAAGEEAINRGPTHPARSRFLLNLGNYYSGRASETKSAEDKKTALERWSEAWRSEAAPWKARVLAGARFVVISAHYKQFDTAAEIARDIIALLSTIDIQSLGHRDRQFVITNFFGIAADACAVSLESGNVKDALQVLENGRAVILRDLMKTQSEPSAFKTGGTNPAESPASKSNSTSNILTHTDTVESMMACASGGTIVVVNVTEISSDAIIVSSTEIKSLKLPSLSIERARYWLAQDWYDYSKEKLRQKDFSMYLEWLWTVCVKDILEALEAHQSLTDNELPRVWWIGSGYGSSMPFHAAGIHKKKSTEIALTQVISSYAPSIKVLGFARRRACCRTPKNTKVLAITMSTTPDMDDLKVEEEAEAIFTMAGTLSLPPLHQPRVEDVLKKLETSNIVHFACHGKSDPVDPMKSAIVLERNDDGSAMKLVQDPLTMADIARKDLTQAWIAFLAACETAENKAFRLADEALHIGSGFQAADFPHVICSLWAADSPTSAAVAKGFYERLFKQSDSLLGGREIASILQETVKEYYDKDRCWELPLFWAAFVHYGA